MSNTNRDTALKNAINRTVSFSNILTASTTKCILKLEKNSYYKVFLKDNQLTMAIEILNGSIFTVNLTNSESTTLSRTAAIAISGNYAYLFVGGFNSNTSLSLEYFDTFELNPLLGLPSTPTLKTYNSDQIYYEKPVITSSMSVKDNLVVNNLYSDDFIKVNKIKFGKWTFNLTESSGTVAEIKYNN